LLARREHSTTELVRKLSKNFLKPDSQGVLADLVQEGLISHERFVENYIHSRRQKGYGPIRIQAELMERGIAEDFIDHHLNMADNAWFIGVRTAWQKRFKNQIPRDFKTRAQQMRFLQYRGFTLEQIESIFNE